MLLTALVTAQAVAQAAPATDPATAAPADLRTVDWSFRQLGMQDSGQLRGLDSAVRLDFGVRLDETVTRARLKLRYTWSPSLLPDLSHLKLSLNGEIVATIALPKEQAGNEVTREIELDPRYFSDYNHLEIRLIGHYTRECEDALHSSIWTSINSHSSLELSLHPLVLQPDLGLLPTPLFDPRDNRRLELPMAFAGPPTLDALHAAGVVASWLGAKAGFRSARFPALLDALPAHHGIVFATNADHPSWLALQPVQAPTLRMIDHPRNPAVKLLLIQGRDGKDLRTAAEALALGQVVLSGDSASVTAVKAQPRREAYDAPNWLRTDRPVKFGELVATPLDLQVSGHRPPAIRINLRVAPDLLTWNKLGVPLDLRYRYTPPVEQDNSMLNVAINDGFLQSMRLRPNAPVTEKNHLLVPLLENGLAQGHSEMVIPSFRVGSNNQLQFQFITDYHKQGWCKDTESEIDNGVVDPDSTIDLRRFPHYTALPDLALFAEGGFPFTKFADLAETSIVLPAAPKVQDIQVLLFMLGRLGRITGVPALGFHLMTGKDVEQAADTDLLLLGDEPGKDLLARWNKSLPAVIEQTRRVVSPRTPASAFPRDLPDRPLPAPPQWSVDVQSSGPLSALIAFESPLKHGRSVVAIAASTAKAADAIIDALEDDGRVGQIRGDVAFVRGRNIDSFDIRDKYYVGYLPPWLWIRFHLSGHPVLVALLGIFAGLLLALMAHWHLRRVAARRLSP